MTRPPFAILLLCLALAVSLYLRFQSRHHASSSNTTSAFPGAIEKSGLSPVPKIGAPDGQPGRATVVAGAPRSEAADPSTTSEAATAFSVSPTTSNPEPIAALDTLRSAIRDYGSMFGGNPVGNNAEITRALNGDNPKQVRFLRSDGGLSLNAKGELVDSWGTPFFFHQLSGTDMEIRSAGPDRKMWTRDDLITR